MISQSSQLIIYYFSQHLLWKIIGLDWPIRSSRIRWKHFGAVLIMGQKWCGKTTTAEQVAKSAIYMQNQVKMKEYQKVMDMNPSIL